MNKDEILNGVVLSKSELGVVSMNKDEVLNDGSLSNSLPFIGCNGHCCHHKVQFEYTLL